MNFNLKKPCENCPFRKVGAIELMRGRLDGIIESLTQDTTYFNCHKTVHSRIGGEWDEDGGYKASGNESVCVGSLVYMLKAHNVLPVVARMAIAFGELDLADLKAQFGDVIDPVTLPDLDA